MRQHIYGVKTDSWRPTAVRPPVIPALTDAQGRALPSIGGAPVALLEGPSIGTRIFRVGAWDVLSDRGKLRKLRKLALEYGHDPRLRWFVVNEILTPAGVQPRDFPGQLNAIFSWAQQNIYYTNESGEHIQAPWWTLRYRTGDCDDIALLLAAMLTTLSYPFRFALSGQHLRTKQYTRWVEGEPMPGPIQFSHIYLYAGDQPFQASQWIAMEGTLKGVPLGYDVAAQGLPQGVVARDMAGLPFQSDKRNGGNYGAPPIGSFGVSLAPVAQPMATPSEVANRAANVEAYRTLPPHEAMQQLGLTGFVTQWIDWNRMSSSVVEGVLTTALVAVVLSAVDRRRRN